MDIRNTFAVFQEFESGFLRLPQKTVALSEIPWSPHPVFPGVALKHILTGRESEGQYSFHLVRIAPGMSIGRHVHEGRTETHEVIQGDGCCRTPGAALAYAPGVVSLLPADIPHEVQAGDAGLYLFAKFFPALC